MQELRSGGKAAARTWHGAFRALAIPSPRIIPKDADLRRAADVLNAGKKSQCWWAPARCGATDEVIEVAEILGAGVAKALLGKAVVPDDLPFCTGSIGLLGTQAELGHDDGMRHAADGRLEFSLFGISPEGRPGARRADRHRRPRMLGIRYPMEVNLIGDSAETLRALIPLLETKEDRSWRETIEEKIDGMVEGARSARDERARIRSIPQRVFWELSPRLPDNCILSRDSGSSANWFARDLKIRRGMMASLSGNLATMGPGVPYAVAAKFAFPDRVGRSRSSATARCR